MDDSTVCPESTLESANMGNSARKPVLRRASTNGNKLVCESTIESANRRNFIKKAAVMTAAAGIGSTSLARDVFPSSTAASFKEVSGCSAANKGIAVCGKSTGAGSIGVKGTSTGCYLSCSCIDYFPIGVSGTATKLDGIGVSGLSCGSYGIGVQGKSSGICGTGVQGYAAGCCAKAGVAGFSRTVGVLGCSTYIGVCGQGTIGVNGHSCCDTGVNGYSVGKYGVGVNGVSCKGIGVAAVSRGCLAICGRSTTPNIGKFQNSLNTIICCTACRDKSALIQVQTGDSTPFQWNLGVAGNKNALSIPDGTFYFQQLSFCCSGGAKVVINKCGAVGIGTISPSSTLCVAGQVHATCSAPSSSAMIGFQNGAGQTTGVYGYAGSSCGRGVYGYGSGFGVVGRSCCGVGVQGFGQTKGVIGVSGSKKGIPIIAQGAACQSAPLQEWQNCSGKALSVINKCGWLGVNTCKPQTNLQVKGGMSLGIKTVTSFPSCVYDITTNCFAILANPSAAGKSVQLPPAKNEGMVVYIKNISSKSVNVKAAGTDTIEGNPTYSLAGKNVGVTLIASGGMPGTWYVLSTGN
jgi:hypothetical protein